MYRSAFSGIVHTHAANCSHGEGSRARDDDEVGAFVDSGGG